jgi:hypothetical protein
MTAGLDISDVVNVSVTLTPRAAPTRNFGVPLYVGSSEVIDTYERLRLYVNLGEVLDDFDTTTPEYQAAKLYFSQKPVPPMCYIGRWAQTPTSAILHGGVLTPLQQAIANFAAVTGGAFFMWIDGAPYNIGGLNLSAQTTLNGVAYQVQEALQVASPDSTFTWDLADSRFVLASGSTGLGSTLSWANAPTAWGGVAFSGLPSNNDTIAIAGTTVTFVTGTPGDNEVAIVAGNLSQTLENLQVLTSESTDAGLAKCNYFLKGSHFYAVAAASGAAGNLITMSATGSSMTTSNLAAGKLTGGAGTDVSGLLRLSSAMSAPAPIPGIAAETALACAAIMADRSNGWYAMQIVAQPQPSLQDSLDVAGFVEGASPARIYNFTAQDSEVIDPMSGADIAAEMHASTLARTLGQYSSTSAWAVASLFGRFASVDYTAENSVITGKFKVEPGVTPETMSETQAAAADAKCINYFVNYDTGSTEVAIVQQAVMCNGDFVDERIGCDWFQNALQVALFDALFTFPKVPQTDDGTGILLNKCKQVCQAAIFNGWAAPGLWTGPSFGQLKNGQTLDTGFYVFAPSYSTQSQADREARKSVPIFIALKLAGAVHSVMCSVFVNR